MTKKEYLAAVEKICLTLLRDYSCYRYDAPPKVMLGAMQAMLDLRPKTVLMDEFSAVFDPWFKKAQGLECTDKDPCPKCQATRARLAAKAAA